METKTQEEIMADGGYVKAVRAAEAVGASQVGTIHRMINDGTLKATRLGKLWYVTVKSLLEAYKDAPPILERIKALGVAPKDDESSTTLGTKKKGGKHGRSAAGR